MKKSAFTMLELVFVIAVIGILASAIIPRIDRDTLYEASEQLLNDIRYTQHMAMMDDVYDDTDQSWFQHRWKIDFSGNQYAVSKSTDGSLSTHSIIALDPQTHNRMDGALNSDYDLQARYSVTVNLNGNNPILFFDHLGRPHSAPAGIVGNTPTSTVMSGAYTLTLSEGAQTATITIRPETGYTTIVYN